MVRALAVHHGLFGRIAVYRFNTSMVVHAHREAHLTFLIDGPEADMPVAGRPGPLTHDTAVACSPWVPHAFRPGSLTEPSTFLVLYVSPIWFSRTAADGSSSVKFGSSLLFRTQKIRGYVNKLVDLMSSGERSDLVEGYIYELSQECLDESFRQMRGAPYRNPSMRAVDFRVRRAINNMQTRVAQTNVVEEIAKSSGLSRPHFFKLFRDQTGLTPNVYLNTLRVEKAIDQLRQPREPIAAISDGLGFSSQASFSRFFASHVGVPPGEYRRIAAD